MILITFLMMEMMNNKWAKGFYIICSILLLVQFNTLNANDTLPHKQEKKNYFTYKTLNASGILGAQIYNDNFLYNPGYALNYSAGKNIHQDIAIGIGSGFVQLSNESFIPLYFEVIGNKKNKSNTPFIRFQAGYSIGWNNSGNENYEMEGGYFFNAGVGRKIQVNDKYALLFYWSYYHQFAELEYEVFGKHEYEETVNYDMLQISIGLMFK